MNSKPGLLQNIRQQILDRQNGHNPKPKCPKCAGELTVDTTPYFTSEICEHCHDYVKITDNKECCETSKYHAVKLITASGSIQVKEQCQSCGNVNPSALGGFTKEQKDRLPLLDENLRQRRYDSIRECHRATHAKITLNKGQQYEKKKQDRREAWFQQYNKYLDSPEWRRKRELVLKRDNYLCQCCLKNTATQVHHKSYEFVDMEGGEPAFDLVSICPPCHERIEKVKSENRKSKTL